MKAKKPTVLKTPLWMPVYISEHVADTGRQSAAEHGAYMRLLYSYWRSGPPPNDDATLARIAGMSPSEWKSARPEVERHFSVNEMEWQHPALDAELESAYLLISANKGRTEAATMARAAKREGAKQRNARDVHRDVVCDVDRDVRRQENAHVVPTTSKRAPPLAKAKIHILSAQDAADLAIAEAGFLGGASHG